MKKNLLVIGMFVLGLVFFQTPVWAELIQGEIVSLNTKANSFGLRHTDPMSGKVIESKIMVQPNAELEGIESLNELKKGDRVLVDASQSEAPGTLQATAIEVAKA